MTPAELHELNALLEKSPAGSSKCAKANKFLDAIIARNDYSRGLTGWQNATCYTPLRPQADLGALPGRYAPTLAWLCISAGLFDVVRRLHREQEAAAAAGQPPPLPGEPIEGEPWLVPLQAKRELDFHPDDQAMACLRLLYGPSITPEVARLRATHPWVQDAARARLMRLVIDFPALLHPRILFRPGLNERKGPHCQARSLLHTLLWYTDLGLPTIADGFTEAEVTKFACSRALDIAVHSKGFKIDHHGDYKPGTTLAYELRDLRDHRPEFMGSLLQLERLRAAAGATELLDGDREVEALLCASAVSFAATWIEPPTTKCSAFLAEFQVSPMLHRADYSRRMIGQAPRVFYDPDDYGVAIPASDAGARLLRCAQALIETGAANSNAEAAELISGAVFTKLGGGSIMPGAAFHVSFAGARDVLVALESLGQPFVRTLDLINASFALQGPLYDTARESLEIERSMRRVLDLQAQAQPLDSADSRSRRASI